MAAVEARVGLAGPLGAPLPRGGAEEAVTPRGRVRVCFDRVYPKPGAGEGPDGIVALTRKRSPDATVEWWPTGGQPVVMAVDATWSRNPTYHDDKLGYARSLAAEAIYTGVLYDALDLGSLDSGPVFSGYLGMVLFACAATAIGRRSK